MIASATTACKGLHLLAGAQGTEPAFELQGLGHGALTYTLFAEGLLRKKADVQPTDGFIGLAEWLRYGAEALQTLEDGGALRGVKTPGMLPRRLRSGSSC